MKGLRWIAGIRPRGAFAGPAGAALLIVCFFLPWARFSCGPGFGRTISGQGLGGIARLAVVAALALLAAFLLLWRSRRLHLAWPLPAATALTALVAIAAGLNEVSRGINLGVTHVKPTGLHVDLRPGGIGTIAGLFLLLLGTVLLLPHRRPPAPGNGA